jgi:hypothetical protein
MVNNMTANNIGTQARRQRESAAMSLGVET